MFKEKKILEQVMQKQRDKGVPEEKILKEALSFLTGYLDMQRSEKIRTLNSQVARGIEELAKLEEYINLEKIAYHAMEEGLEICKKCVEREGSSSINRSLLSFFTVRNKLMKMSLLDLKKACKPEFIDQFFQEKEK